MNQTYPTNDYGQYTQEAQQPQPTLEMAVERLYAIATESGQLLSSIEEIKARLVGRVPTPAQTGVQTKAAGGVIDRAHEIIEVAETNIASSRGIVEDVLLILGEGPE